MFSISTAETSSAPPASSESAAPHFTGCSKKACHSPVEPAPATGPSSALFTTLKPMTPSSICSGARARSSKSAVLLAAALLSFPGNLAGQLLGASAAPSSPEDRATALHAIFHDYWEQTLKRQPEFASSLGDKRYNDKISDCSVKAVNDWLAEEQDMLLKLAALDATGLSDQDQVSRELLLHDLTEDQESAEFKEWEMPVNQMGGIYATYPQLVAQLSFATAKDYDDWIARLRAIPHAFEQVTANMSLGIDDKRVPPKYLLEKTLDHVKQLASQKPEDSPLALPLKKFPDSISAAEQTRIKTEMLAAISKQVLPAYQRFARFLEVAYIPAGRTEPGIS